jgi:hypothetical protein
MKINEIYTVEYSVVQRCYHIDTLDKTLENNLTAVCRNINNGYLIIGYFGSHEAASEFVDYHRNHSERLGIQAMIEETSNKAF